jgi:DNA end-binding protein Ku
MVNVPVKLYSAVEPKTVHFHEVHLDDGSAIEHRRFCSKEDKPIPYDQVVKGYEVKSGEYVVLEKEDLKAAAGPRTKLIDVEHFLDVGAIDPVFFDRAYYLGAGDGGEDAYRVLLEALGRTERAAIGRFTFHNREYLAAIRSLGDVLGLHTMRFAAQLRDGGDIDAPAPSKRPAKREVEMAAQLLESLAEEFDPPAYEDEYREAVLDLIKRKAAGKEVEVVADDAPPGDTDLMATLKASLEAGHSGRQRRAAPKRKSRKRTRA